MSTTGPPKFISNWQKYNTFLKKQDSFLADVFGHYKDKKPTYEYERVLSGLLHRYAMNFRVIYRSWEDFLGNSKFKFSIYSLLRPLTADCLLMLYLLEEFKFLVPTDDKTNADAWQVREDDFINRYESITSSFFQRLDSNLRKKVKNRELSATEMQDILSHHQKEFPEYFQGEPKIEVLKNWSLTPGQMVEQIVHGKPFVKDLYDHYFRLSQFEHFTFITEGLMNDVDNNWEMIHIVEVTNYLLDALNVNISTIRAPQHLMDKARTLINEFRTIQWMTNGDNSEATENNL